MPAPSTRTGVPTALAIVLLTAILLVGFGLAPRAFEFRAWPQPTRGDIDDVVARSANEATEIPVVPVRRESRGRTREDRLAVRGRGDRRRDVRPELSVRSAGPTRDTTARDRRGRGDDAGGPTKQAPVTDVVIVDETPAPAPEAPVTEPAQPAQLAEVMVPPQVLRPDAEQYLGAGQAKPAARGDAVVAAGADTLGDEADRLLDSPLQDERRGHGRGRRGHR